MKVLWILNTPLPEALSVLSGKPEDSHSTGSWVHALFESLSDVENIQLTTAAPSPLVKQMQVIDGKRNKHIIFPSGKASWKSIHNLVMPDVVHIHGTEYPLGLEYVKTCGQNHVVASLQGMASSIVKAYWAGMTPDEVKKSKTIRDTVRNDTMQNKFDSIVLRGKAETELLGAISHVIGRTSWDKDMALSINSSLCYHHCDELIRKQFLTGCWTSDRCRPHTIFMSQGYYPLKGVHKVVEALPIVLQDYPDTKLRIAGPDIIRGYGLKGSLLRSGYGSFLVKLIKDNKVEGHISFIGEKNAWQIKDELLHTNVFLIASSIENSPNSLCEAQMLGVPSIASNVGGTSSLIPSSDCGILYQFGNKEELASTICRTFESSHSFNNYRMREIAARRHDPSLIINQLISIYEEIASEKANPL